MEDAGTSDGGEEEDDDEEGHRSTFAQCGIRVSVLARCRGATTSTSASTAARYCLENLYTLKEGRVDDYQH